MIREPRYDSSAFPIFVGIVVDVTLDTLMNMR